MTIQAIAAELGMKAVLMERGQLNAEQIDQLTELSKELYERLIVLRYKAFEAMVSVPESAVYPDNTAVSSKSFSEPAPDYEPAAPVKPIEIKSPIRFGEPEAGPKQISLIDSIEEISKMESEPISEVNAAPGRDTDDDPISLANKLKNTRVSNLKSAIGINQKFLFISTLFDDDKEGYNGAIEKLNSFNSFLDADEYVQNVLKQRYTWQMKNPVVKEFLALIQRRYL